MGQDGLILLDEHGFGCVGLVAPNQSVTLNLRIWKEDEWTMVESSKKIPQNYTKSIASLLFETNYLQSTVLKVDLFHSTQHKIYLASYTGSKIKFAKTNSMHAVA